MGQHNMTIEIRLFGSIPKQSNEKLVIMQNSSLRKLSFELHHSKLHSLKTIYTGIAADYNAHKATGKISHSGLHIFSDTFLSRLLKTIYRFHEN